MHRLISLLLVLVMSISLLGLQPLRANASAADEMDTIIAGYGKSTAVLVWSMDGTTLYSRNPTKTFSGASLIKLPYCYYVCAQIENGVRSLDETITYTQKWRHEGSGIIWHGAYGVDYTIEQLLDYALRYSDNVAYDMLVYLFGIDGFNAMIDRWGYSVHIAQTAPRFPAMSAEFIREAMNRMAIRSDDGGPWELAWDALCGSQTSYVRGILADGETPIAVKYGNVASVWHEACYIGGEHPYILVIMSTAVNYKPDVSYLERVAACAGRIHDEYVLANFDEEPPVPDDPPVPSDPPDSDDLPEPDEPSVPDDLAPVGEVWFGDVNGDGEINAVDALYILLAAANLGTGEESGLNAEQTDAADLDLNLSVDAADAALLLAYTAYLGSGGTDSLAQFLELPAAENSDT